MLFVVPLEVPTKNVEKQANFALKLTTQNRPKNSSVFEILLGENEMLSWA